MATSELVCLQDVCLVRFEHKQGPCASLASTSSVSMARLLLSWQVWLHDGRSLSSSFQRRYSTHQRF